jgi:hypothetical protein
VAVQGPEMQAAASGRFEDEVAGIEQEATKIFVLVQSEIIEPGEAIGQSVRLYRGPSCRSVRH